MVLKFVTIILFIVAFYNYKIAKNKELKFRSESKIDVADTYEYEANHWKWGMFGIIMFFLILLIL